MNGHPPSGTPIEIERPGPGRHVTTIESDGRARRDAGRPAAAPRPAAVRRAQPVAGQRRGRPLPPGPPRAGVLGPADAGDDPPRRHGDRRRRRRARRRGPRDHRHPQGAEHARRRAGRGAPGRRRATLDEGRDLAAGGSRLRLQARRRGRRGTEARREVGPAPRRGAVRAAVLPDARAVRAVDEVVEGLNLLRNLAASLPY